MSVSPTALDDQRNVNPVNPVKRDDDYLSHPFFEHEERHKPRYAVQRARAARLAGLPKRRLLSRARFVGEAHRRLEESCEREAPFGE